MRQIKNNIKSFLIAGCLVSTIQISGQIVVIDPGHGYTSTGGNPDGRTATEIETALSVGLKLRSQLQNECNGWRIHMTRTVNTGGWISVSQRREMSNSWGADRFLSIHCNAGKGTGTESFWCDLGNAPRSSNITFARETQKQMVTHGSWRDRRTVEDDSYLGYHLGVLRSNNAHATLNEIGFVDSSDKNKLLDDGWRNKFAKGYKEALKNSLASPCNGGCLANLNLTSIIGSGVYTSSGTITASARVTTGANVVFDAKDAILLNEGFNADSVNNSSFTAKIGAGCTNARSFSTENLTEDFSRADLDILITDSKQIFDIYPNPASGMVNLSFIQSKPGNVTIKMFNANGTLVYQTIGSKQYDAGDHTITLNTGSYPAGSYFIAYISQGATMVKKVLIHR